MIGLGLGIPFRAVLGGGFGVPIVQDGVLSSAVTFSRTSSATYIDSGGLVATASSGVARVGYSSAGALLGFLAESSRTNVVLWNRDLTNVAWVCTDCTPLKDQTGADGVANSASSLTATAGNATCLQAITLASSARFQTCRIKRITGTGTINMTMDNGATWTAVTVTASWTRVSIPTQTLANPTVGFQIVTSGDAIAVDYVQNENGAYATSDIATTTASVTRAADTASITTLSNIGFTPAAFTFVAEFTGTETAVEAHYIVQSFQDGTNQSIIYFGVSAVGFSRSTAGGIDFQSNAGAYTANTTKKVACAWKDNDCAVSFDGAAAVTDSTVSLPTAPTTLYIGSNAAAANFLNGHIKNLRFFPTRKADATLVSLST